MACGRTNSVLWSNRAGAAGWNGRLRIAFVTAINFVEQALDSVAKHHDFLKVLEIFTIVER